MNVRSDDSFHSSISGVLVLGNFLGFPICGVLSKNVSDLKFSFKSFRNLYSLSVLLMSTFSLICFFYWLTSKGFENLRKFDKLNDLFMNILCVICFQKLAREWPSIMYKWNCVENSLPVVIDSRKRNLLRNRIKKVFLLVMFISVGEFSFLFIFSKQKLCSCLSVENVLELALEAHTATKCHTESGLKAYLLVSHPEIFQIVDSIVVAAFARITSFILLLMGSYRDLFIMCISLALTTRFQQVNKILLDHKGKSMLPSGFWSEHRQYHRKLVGLVNDVDGVINNLMLVAFSNNLLFICTSLLNSL